MKGWWQFYLPAAIVLAAVIGLIAVDVEPWQAAGMAVAVYAAVSLLGRRL